MAIIGLHGLYLIAKGTRLDGDIAALMKWMAVCYAILVGADLLNGGGLKNIETAFNYLPLFALPLFAHALRNLEITRRQIVISIQFTVLLAVAMSLFRALALGENRPGGLPLNPIPYGLVVSFWIVFLLSISLGRGGIWWRGLAIAALGLVPVMLAESKIAIACLGLGTAVVVLLWARETQRWRPALAGVVGAAIVLALGVYLFLGERLLQLQGELAEFMDTGMSHGDSLGYRFEVAVAGLRAFLDQPLIGYGFADRMQRVFSYTTPGGPDVTGLQHLHNDYITHLVAYGVLGLLFLALYFTATMRTMASIGERDLGRAGIAVLSMILLYMSADVAFNMDPVSGALAITLGAILAVGGRPRASDSQAIRSGAIASS